MGRLLIRNIPVNARQNKGATQAVSTSTKPGFPAVASLTHLQVRIQMLQFRSRAIQFPAVGPIEDGRYILLHETACYPPSL